LLKQNIVVQRKEPSGFERYTLWTFTQENACRDLIVWSYIPYDRVLVNNTYNIGVHYRFLSMGARYSLTHVSCFM